MHNIHKHGHRAQSSHHLCKHPSSICVCVCFAGCVQIDAVETRDCDGEDELEEADDKAGETEPAVGIRMRIYADILGRGQGEHFRVAEWLVRETESLLSLLVVMDVDIKYTIKTCVLSSLVVLLIEISETSLPSLF